MLGWLFASPFDRRLLGNGRFRGPTPWVIAIMSFSIMIIGATGLALANTAGSLSEAIQSRYAIEVPNGARNLGALKQALQSAPGVTSVEAVPESEMRRTLERWLGPAASSADLPVPALVNFDAAPGADVGAHVPGRGEGAHQVLEAGCRRHEGLRFRFASHPLVIADEAADDEAAVAQAVDPERVVVPADGAGHQWHVSAPARSGE